MVTFSVSVRKWYLIYIIITIRSQFMKYSSTRIKYMYSKDVKQSETVEGQNAFAL
jgi:hypothetical protein